MTRILISVCMILLMSTAGMAQPEDNLNEKKQKRMGEVVVTGTRFEQETEKIPANVTVITSDDIQKSSAQTVPDLLRNLAGISVRDLNGNGNNQVVDLGGFGETADRHVAIVVNGRRINSIDQSGVRWSLIPVDNIERIEVLYGSGAVLYGDNAMGGVINIITKDIREGVSFDAEILAGSMNTKQGHGIFNYSKGPFGMQLGIEGFDTNGYRSRSESGRKSVFGKFEVFPSEILSLSLEMNAGESDYQLPGALTEAQRDADRKQAVNMADEGEDEEFFIGVGGEIDFGERGLLTVKVNRRDEEIASDMASWFSYVMLDSETDGAYMQYVLDKKIFDHTNRLTAGVDYYNTDYDAFRGAFKGATTNRFNNGKKTISYYLHDEFSLSDTVTINAGARYEDPEIDLASDIAGAVTAYSFNESEVAWHLGVSYSFKPGSKIYTRVYEGFRYPVVDEFLSLFSGAINTSLKQETSEGIELGTRLAVTEDLVINARLYTMDLENEIAWNSATFQNENLEKTRHQGMEADFRYRTCEYASLYGNVGYTEAEFRQGANSGKQIPLVPEWKYSLGIDMEYNKLKGRVQYNYTGERFFGSDYANTQKQMKSISTVDVYVGYEIKNAEIYVNASNIFSEKYSDYGYYNSWGPDFYNYYPMPEAIVQGGIKISF